MEIMAPTQSAIENNAEAKPLWPALLGLFFFGITFRSSSGAYLVGMITLFAWLAMSKRPSIPALPQRLISVSQLYLLVLGSHMLWTLAANEYDLFETFEGYRHYTELLLFIPFSAVIYHCRAYWLQILWVPVFAVVVRVLHRTDFSSLDTTLFYRWIYGFGQHHVTFGMQAMLAIIAAMALTHVSVSQFPSTAKRWTATAGAGCAVALLTQALITSNSRSGWGCLLIGLITLAYCSRKKITALNRKNKVLALFVFLLATTTLIGQNYEKIEHRLAKATQVDFAFTLSVDDLPRDRDVFFARRIHLTNFGWERWSERPLLGHGPAAIRPLLAADPDFHIHPHLHNTYIQVLAELGLIASIALLAVFSVLFYYFWQHRPTIGNTYRPIYNLIAASMLSLAVWSIAAFHLHSSDWRFIFAWYTAFAGFLIRQACSTEQSKNEPPV